MNIERDSARDIGLGAVVVVLGMLEIAGRSYWFSPAEAVEGLAAGAFLMLLVGASVAAYRLQPAAALTLAWLSLATHLVLGIDLLYVELAFGLVSYGTARYGSRDVQWSGAASIPLAAVILGGFTLATGTFLFNGLALGAYDVIGGLGAGFYALVAVASLLPLALPFALGLVLRSRAAVDESRVHEQEAVESRLQAEEVAAARAEQTRLAHDVHDVVGHSLAVILAQAESAQFLGDDPVRLKETMATIATSARQSLQDVRHVLATGTSAAPRSGGVDELIAGLRDSGHEVSETVLGQPRPLPPELETVVYRTLQEMLTNALKHGERSTPIRVLRHWSDGLTLAVENTVPAGWEPGQGGLGLTAMHQRVTAVGGRLDVRQDAGVHTVTATIPLRAA